MLEYEVGTKRSGNSDEYGEIDAFKKVKSDGNVKVRLLLVGRDCGALIGKGGENIKRLKEENQVKMNGLNSRTHDRVLSVEGKKDNVIGVIREIVTVCSEGPYPAYPLGKCTLELNLLVHSDAVGLIIGKGGAKLKEISDQYGGKLKVYPDCLPNSNERVVAVGGDNEAQIVAALEMILKILTASPKIYLTTPYDPANTNGSLGTDGNISSIRVGGPGILGQGDGTLLSVNPIDVAAVLINNRDTTKNSDSSQLDFTRVQTETKLLVPHDMCGAIIGRAGVNIRKIRQSSGAQIDFGEGNKTSKEDRVITITGTQGQVQIAEQLMTQCVRNR